MTLTVAKCLRVSLVRIIKRVFFAFCFEKAEKVMRSLFGDYIFIWAFLKAKVKIHFVNK